MQRMTALWSFLRLCVIEAEAPTILNCKSTTVPLKMGMDKMRICKLPNSLIMRDGIWTFYSTK